ncbi:MAG: acetolactate decarboxylase [Planctomycetota bacterium]
MRRAVVVLPLLAICWFAACQTAPTSTVASWGTMREALHDGHSEGRVDLAGLGGPGVVGVGALAGLAGEITIVDDRVLVARADGTACRVESPGPGDRATLLVRGVADSWLRFPLPDCETYDDLEHAIAARLAELGRDPTAPSPVRIRGRAPDVAYHVIAGACPIAHPEGPPPWRYRGPLDPVELVGVYVEGAEGQLTHHMHSSHLHVVAEGRTGHLDDVALRDAELLLPKTAAVAGAAVR